MEFYETPEYKAAFEQMKKDLALEDAMFALAAEAVEESIAAGKFETICQGCGWPIQKGEKFYHSVAAEGAICLSCRPKYGRI